MKIVFAGTPIFAATILNYLLEQNIKIDHVYTQPDRPQGRGKKMTPSAVKTLALAHHIPISQPETFKDEIAIQAFTALAPDILIVVAYGMLLPKAILAVPRYCLNVHPSLLPRWRGAAPIQHAILSGDTETAVAIMHMVEKLDAGPIAQQQVVPITADTTTADLQHDLALLGAKLLYSCLTSTEPLATIPQATDGITYAHKIEKAMAKIDWQRSAIEIDRQIRAFNPEPGAFTQLHGELIKVWEAALSPSVANATPGRIVALNKDSITVACGEGSLILKKLQFAGGKILPVQVLLNSTKTPLQLKAQFE